MFIGLEAQTSVQTDVISITGVAKDSVVTGTITPPAGKYPVMIGAIFTCDSTAGQPKFTYSITASNDGTDYAIIKTATHTMLNSTISKALTLDADEAVYYPYYGVRIETIDSTGTAGYDVDINWIRWDK